MWKSLAINVLRTLTLPARDSTVQRKVSLALKILITGGALVYIFFRLKNEDSSVWEAVLELDKGQLSWIFAAFLLIPLNLGLEAEKWRTMIRRFYPITYWNAYQAILAGLTTGIFTPNGVGAYAGRVLYLESGQRVEAAVLTFLDRMCQMLITLWMGTLALEYFLLLQQDQIAEWMARPRLYLGAIRFFMWALSMIALVFALFPRLLYRILQLKTNKGKVLSRISEALDSLNRGQVWKVLLLGLMRYGTFSFQYVCLMRAFGYDEGLMAAFVMIWTVFFVKSIIPSISVTELGIRETVAINIMGGFGVMAATAFTSTFVLYVFNIILPAILGVIFIRKLKFDWKL